jgi:hypothetical protein
MDDMKTRYRELYLSFLRLDKLKKMTTSKNDDQISSDQKKEIQDEARRVGLLLKEYEARASERFNKGPRLWPPNQTLVGRALSTKL